jgi:hypothetical protein
MKPFLSSIEKPSGLVKRLAYLLYSPAIRQNADTVKSTFCALAACVRSVLRKDRQARPKADPAAGDRLLTRQQVARLNLCLFCIDIGRTFSIKAMIKETKFERSTNTEPALFLPTQNALRWTM